MIHAVTEPDNLILDTLRMAFVFVRDDNATQRDRRLLDEELVKAIAAAEAKEAAQVTGAQS